MKIELSGFPDHLPPGAYDVDGEVTYTKTAEPSMRLRFRALTPAKVPPPKAQIMVEIDPAQVANMTDELRESFGAAVGMIYEHGPGCCCTNCPHRGNCRD